LGSPSPLSTYRRIDQALGARRPRPRLRGLPLLPRGMLLRASAAASHPLLLLPARTGGRGGAPPRFHAAKLDALNGRLLRSSSSTLSCSCSPSPSPGDGGKGSAHSLFDVIPFMSDETPFSISVLQISLGCSILNVYRLSMFLFWETV
jgi:hypothetical protein